MCGITGFLNCGNEPLLQGVTNLISHRGPDDQGTIWFDSYSSGLGHRRLSILDLSTAGHQPMAALNGEVWIVFNGEIYNYREIRSKLSRLGHTFTSNTDTEVILKSYLHWGKDCLSQFNGMFAFAIYDLRLNELFAARDRIGIKPFYYFHQNDALVFASEIKSILASGMVEKEIDFEAIHTPVHFQIGPRTGFKDIRKLLPGHYFIFKDGELKVQKYWDIHPVEDDEMGLHESIDRLDDLLSSSTKYQMLSDVPIGILLSGGLDSSLIASLMAKNTNQRINSFTIKFKEDDLKLQGNVDDSFYADQIARQFDFNHHEIILEPDIVEMLPKLIWHLDEPIADPSAISTYLISREAKNRNISVLLNGMGGDEVFSGYRSHLACLFGDWYSRYVPSSVHRTVKYSAYRLPNNSRKSHRRFVRWSKEFLDYAMLPPFERYLASGHYALRKDNFDNYFCSSPLSFEDTLYYRRQKEMFLRRPRTDYLTRICLNDSKSYLPDHNLTYVDKASMAVGVECRPPLIDHRIVEFAFSLTPDLRIRRTVQKFLLKKVADRYLPKDVIYRPKAPFSAPLRAWLRGPLRQMVGDLLSEEAIKRRGIYNHRYVASVLRSNDQGWEDNSHVIWRLITNELWFSTFFDQDLFNWSYDSNPDAQPRKQLCVS